MNTFTKTSLEFPRPSLLQSNSTMGLRELCWLILLAVLALAARLACWSDIQMIWPDEAWYIGWGQNLAFGRPFNAFAGLYKGQPLLPLLLAPVCRIAADPAAMAPLVAVALGVLTIIPLHFCARMLGGRGAALWSDAVYAMAPFAIEYSTHAMPHAPFNLFFFLALLFALKCQQSGRTVWACAAGLSVWGCYISRPEGFALWVFLLAGGLLLSGRTLVRPLFAFAASFLLLSLPVWFWIKMETGTWQLAWTSGHGAGGVLLKRWSAEMSSLGVSHSGFATDWKTPLAILYHCAREGNQAISLLPEIWPLLLWIFAGFGVLAIFQEKHYRKPGSLVLYFAAFPLLFYPLVAVERRMLHPAFLVLIPFAGIALHRFCEFLHARGLCTRTAAAAGCTILLILNFLPQYGLLALHNRKEPLGQKQMGEWIRKNATGPQVIFGPDSRCGFYAQEACKRFVQMTDSAFIRIRHVGWERFLRTENMDLVVADKAVMRDKSSGFQFLVDAPPDILVPVVRLRGEDGPVLLYRVDRVNTKASLKDPAQRQPSHP